MLRVMSLHLIMKHACSGDRTPTGGVPSGRANHYTTAPLTILPAVYVAGKYLKVHMHSQNTDVLFLHGSLLGAET